MLTQPETVAGGVARILIVDDYPLFRRGVASLIDPEPDLEVCGEAADCAEALRLAHHLRPDAAIIDLTLIRGSGLELCKDLMATYPDMKVLVVSAHDETLYAERALRSGARGFVSKLESPERVVQGLRAILAGRTFLSGRATQRLISLSLGAGEEGVRSSVDLLTDRELEALECIGRGYGVDEIAAHMTICRKTVESYKEIIKRKLGFRRSTELTRFAVQWVLEHR